MTRKRRPRSGPDSVWRILRRLAREARRHEEWRRRFEIEERARERAFRCRPEYVRHFLRKMERFRALFPEYAAGAVHGAMAYLTATESAPVMAAKRGLLLIRVVGSSASIVNAPAFEPRNF